MKNLYIHIGLHKTGTKFFQTEFFPKLSQFQYVPRHIYLRAVTEKFLKSDYLVFKNYIPYILDFLADHSNSNEDVILSEELFSGNPFFEYTNRFIILQKLKDTFPNAKIILSIRGQKNLIDSLYREYIVQGGTKYLSEFLGKEGRKKSVLSYDPTLDLESFKYGSYLDFIEHLFGQENFFVFPYEKLVDKPQELLEDLLRFMEAPLLQKQFDLKRKHESLNVKTLHFIRKINRFYNSAFNPGGMIGFKYHLLHKIRNFNFAKKQQGAQNLVSIDQEIFEEDNQYIDHKFKLSLRQDYEDYYFKKS